MDFSIVEIDPPVVMVVAGFVVAEIAHSDYNQNSPLAVVVGKLLLVLRTEHFLPSLLLHTPFSHLVLHMNGSELFHRHQSYYLSSYSSQGFPQLYARRRDRQSVV